MRGFIDTTGVAWANGRVRVTRTLLLAAIASAFIPGIAFAQDAPPAATEAPVSQTATPAPRRDTTSNAPAEDDIIVTAFKREQTLSTVPQGISVVTGAQLDARGAKSLSDFIALTPGVSLQSIGAAGYGKVEIRGISPLVVAGTVAIYVDDVPITSSSQTTRGGLFSPDLDPSDIERVEVLKGPQGTLYGASSLGGVIKYVLKKPSLTKTEITTSEEMSAADGGGDLGVKLRGSVSTPLSDTLAVRVSGFYRHDPGFIDNVGPLAKRDENDGDAWGVRGALYWKPTTNFSVDLTASVQNAITRGYSSVDLDWQTFKPLFGQDKHERWTPEGLRVRSEIFAGTLTWDTGIGTLLSASSYSHIAPRDIGDITYQQLGLGITETTPAAAVGRHVNNQFSQELRFTSKRFGPFELLGGAFYQHATQDDAEDFTPYKTTGSPDPLRPTIGQSYGTGTLDEYAGFINGTVYLSNTLDFTAGYRFSHIDQTRQTVQGGLLYGVPNFSRVTDQSTSEDASTYQFGGRWRPTKDLMFYVRAASGYRPGGSRSVPPAAPVETVPYYKSDSIWSYEAGLKVHTLGGRVTFDADVFRIDWTDIQTLIYYGFFSTTGNGGKARSQGGEIQGSFEPFRGLILSGNAAYTDAKYTEDAPEVHKIKGELVPSVPKWTATAGISYNWALNNDTKANIGGDYSYKSSMYDSSAEPYTVPSYSTFNLLAGIETRGLGINLYVKNLTNKRAIVGTSQGYYSFFNPFIVIVNDPRTYGISFTQKF